MKVSKGWNVASKTESYIGKDAEGMRQIRSKGSRQGRKGETDRDSQVNRRGRRPSHHHFSSHFLFLILIVPYFSPHFLFIVLAIPSPLPSLLISCSQFWPLNRYFLLSSFFGYRVSISYLSLAHRFLFRVLAIPSPVPSFSTFCPSLPISCSPL